MGQSQGSRPARKNTTFFLQRQGPKLSARTEGVAVNFPSLIAAHSPFIFNNLQFREKVVFQVSWGANLRAPSTGPTAKDAYRSGGAQNVIGTG
jgi:hypothetical protein